MYFVLNLNNGIENYYEKAIPKKQALKISYALDNNLSTKLSTNFEELMIELENKIIETNNCFHLDYFSVKK